MPLIAAQSNQESQQEQQAPGADERDRYCHEFRPHKGVYASLLKGSKR